MTDRISDIKKRLAAVPEGHWHSVTGSGTHVMTGVCADPVDGPGKALDDQTFICDVLPEYMVSDNRAWALREPLLNFIINAPEDIRYLLEENARLREIVVEYDRMHQ